MRRLFLLPILLLLGTAAAPRPLDSTESSYFQLPPIIHAQLWGSEVLLIHEDRSSTLVSIADLVIVPGVANMWGYPTVASNVNFKTNPNVLETKYTSSRGEHRVITACKGMSEVRCAQKHKKQLVAFQTVFPKTS